MCWCVWFLSIRCCCLFLQSIVNFFDFLFRLSLTLNEFYTLLLRPHVLIPMCHTQTNKPVDFSNFIISIKLCALSIRRINCHSIHNEQKKRKNYGIYFRCKYISMLYWYKLLTWTMLIRLVEISISSPKRRGNIFDQWIAIENFIWPPWIRQQQPQQ